MPLKIFKCLGVLLLFVLACAGITHFYMVTKGTMFLAAYGHQDTHIFVSAAQRLFAGGKLYELVEPLYVTYAPGMAVFKFPPIYVLPYLPWLEALKGPEATQWYIKLYHLHWLRYVLSAALVFWFFGPRKNAAWLFSVIAVFGLASPIYESLYGMTFENLFLLLLIISLVFLRRGVHLPAIILLSFSGLAKIYPAPMVMFFATRQRWKAIVLFAVSCIIWTALAVMMIGLEPHIDYAKHIFPVLLKEDANIWRMNTTILYDPIIRESWRKPLLAALVLSTLALLNFRSHRTTQNSIAMEFCLVLLTSMLLLKNFWVNYQIVLLLPICVLIGIGFSRFSARSFLGLAVAVAAFIPLLSSMSYEGLGLPCYDGLISQDTEKFFVNELGSARQFSAPLLWLGVALLLLTEKFRKPAAD